MRHLLTLALAACASAALADERTVVVPRDDKPFTVEQGDFVRLTARGIAGSRFAAHVDGPARLATASNVRELVGGRALLGNVVREFELKPTGTGKVTVTVSVTPPQPNTPPRVSKWTFEVK
jgi:hypothetical protein